MTESVVTAFAAAFGNAPTVLTQAPGRVNLFGEHIDYNDGFVLPIAIPQHTAVALRARSDRQVHVWSSAFEQATSYALGSEAPTRAWSDYVKGVTRGLAHAFITARGFEGAIVSSVPLGAGLSSSAALAVALLRGLRRLFSLQLSELDLARVAHWGESNVAGAPVGILDPMACNFADVDAALLLDTRTLAFERVPSPPPSSWWWWTPGSATITPPATTGNAVASARRRPACWAYRRCETSPWAIRASFGYPTPSIAGLATS